MKFSGLFTRGLRAGFPMLLVISLTSPAWGVVFSNTSPINIVDPTNAGIAGPYPSQINVGGMTGTITKVTLTLANVNKGRMDDLDLMLVAPGGNNLLLLSDAGGNGIYRNLSITFDDAAANPMPDGGPVNGTIFKPSQYDAFDTFPAPAPAPSANTTFAAAFNGIDPNGTWSLYAVDDLLTSNGSIGNGWILTVTTTGTGATAFANSSPILVNDPGGRGSQYPSLIVVSGLTGAITDVNVTLMNVNHPNPDDLGILLIGPTGKRVVLMNDAGGSTDLVGVNITLTDEAGSALPNSGAITTNDYRPMNYDANTTFPQILTVPGRATLAHAFNGTDPNGTWRLYVISTWSSDLAGGWSLDISAGGTYGAKRFTSGDFDGDGLTDTSVFRPSENNWWLRDSSTLNNRAINWGLAGDKLIPADYDGDNKTDIAIFRPSNGLWCTFFSGTNTAQFSQWGISTDIPVPSDYDGDGKQDIAIFRESNGQWWVYQSSNATPYVVQWGTTGDIPVRGHFNGFTSTDFAVFRPSNGRWYIANYDGTIQREQAWGISGDKPIPADYDGDRKTDLAVRRGASWLVYRSGTGTVTSDTWGQSSDIAASGDYDGDGIADFVQYRPSEGGWWMILSSAGFTPGVGGVRQETWGGPLDTPVPYSYFP